MWLMRMRGQPLVSFVETNPGVATGVVRKTTLWPAGHNCHVLHFAWEAVMLQAARQGSQAGQLGRGCLAVVCVMLLLQAGTRPRRLRGARQVCLCLGKCSCQGLLRGGGCRTACASLWKRRVGRADQAKRWAGGLGCGWWC